MTANINAAIKEVIIRIIKGEKVRVKQEYKETVFDIMKQDYPAVNILIVSEDDQYVYIRKVHDTVPGYTPEEMAKAVHDCNGNPVTSEDGVVTGYGFQGKLISDTDSNQCFARQVIYTDTMKNEYYIATNRQGGLFNPMDNTERGRTGWIRCNKIQFHTYLTALQTGRTFDFGNLRTELKIN